MSFNWKSTLRRIFVSPLKAISVLIAVCLLLSYLSLYISPAKFWPIAYFGLLFQLFFVLNIILLIIWALLRRKIVWVHLAVLLPSILFISSFIQLFSEQGIQRDNDLKVISYNVQMFQLRFKKTDSTYLKIAAFLNSEKTDIVCLQEFYTAPGKLEDEDFSLRLSGLRHSYVYYSVEKKSYEYGIAIYSRYPIIDKGVVFTSPTGNAAIYADIDIDGKIIRVYNNHLQSIRLNLPKSVRSIVNSNDERMGEIADVSLRLKAAFIKRAEQVNKVSAHVRQSPYPVVVCGDFNDTPMSYTYNTMKRGLKDAFCEAGQGMPSTHEGFFPSFRIDYILHDKQINTTDYSVSDVQYSDHFPIISKIDIGNISI
ncbi:MAG: endonuclease/exonuclease/phosphatase family protein [Prevotellaceae bacterium]|jgi:endonuclease/exonuclease/phosphatase family metal-dependent hydrolase|nr:endonuclease/exonuclease/phosphatase family protein [Prevotellaceae bacterium]